MFHPSSELFPGDVGVAAALVLVPNGDVVGALVDPVQEHTAEGLVLHRGLLWKWHGCGVDEGKKIRGHNKGRVMTPMPDAAPS